jgi:hypothetical protein
MKELVCSFTSLEMVTYMMEATLIFILVLVRDIVYFVILSVWICSIPFMALLTMIALASQYI